MKPLRFLFAIAALAATACGGDSAEVRLTATTDTVDGVPRLTYPAESAGTMDWSLDTVAVLGDAFADDAYQFDEVSSGGLVADADGNLYLLDRQSGRVLKYGPDGRHLGTFGRRGEGPGELNQPISLAVGPGGTIWVSDFSNRRFTGFPQDGGDAVSLPLPEEGGIPGSQLAAFDYGFITMIRPLFGFRAAGGARVAFGSGGGGDEEGESVLPLMALDDSLVVRDTLWTAPQPPMDMVQLEAGGNVMITMMQREFYPDFQWAAFPDGGLVVADSAAYAIHVLGPAGARERVIARDPAPRATTDEDREFARQRVRDQSSQGGGIRVGGGGGPDEDTRNRLLEERISKMTFADVIPRVVELAVDPAERIWVGVSETRPDEVDRIDIYHRDGTLLGELRDFPFPDVFLTANRIGVLRRDDLDVQQVVILDVNRMEQEVAAEQ